MNKIIDELCINTIRFLSIDAVQKANSGHPGMPLGAAPIAYVLWDKFLKHNPANPKWFNRDRFILSAGHASAMLYSLLYLTGYDLSIEEIKNFRQWNSKTPGHPEYGVVPGVEATTGPLGQGFANGVGMAMAERWLATQFNKPDNKIIDHYTYAIVSDGDMQEGISSEAASLAGTLQLGKLIYLYDDNDISIEGSTDITFTESVSRRFSAYGWQVIGPIDGSSVKQIASAIKKAQSDKIRPSLIICRTVIAYGSPNKAGKASAHGEPLGEEEVKLTKKNLGWQYENPFTVPQEALSHMRQALERGFKWQEQWEQKFSAYKSSYPHEARQLEDALSKNFPEDWYKDLDTLFKDINKPISTREASGQIINTIAGHITYLVGGSADLAPSTKTIIKDAGDYSTDNYRGRNIHFGVREHAMGAIANGMALHGGVIPYTGTFLVFYDYMRTPVRLAALMGIQVIFIFSHDSVGVGEDGPTHQPVEQLLGLRSVPNLVTIRPADATETAVAWKVAIENKNSPTALVLSRQNLPILDRTKLAPADGLQKGGYILWESKSEPDIIIIGAGSEVHIALEAGLLLQKEGISTRVVSLPSWELFQNQTEEYRDMILPPKIKRRIAVEAGVTLGWERYVGLEGKIIGLNRFGVSAPGQIIYEKFGLTPQNIIEKATKLLEGKEG